MDAFPNFPKEEVTAIYEIINGTDVPSCDLSMKINCS